MPTYQRHPLRFTHGRGMRLWDVQGNEYLDAIAGVAVTNLGHAHPEIAEAISDQAMRLLHTSNLFEIEWQENLAQRLCELAGMESVFFCNSGAEANETAIKLARLHARVRGVALPSIVVMENSFHGRTLATLSATGSAAVQEGFSPLVEGFVRVPANDIEAIGKLAAARDDIVAVLLETVQGEGGVRVVSSDYLRALRALCDENGWLMMIDEIQTGLGRTGAWFDYQRASVRPDVVTLAKGLGNGIPIGACLAGGAAARLFTPGRHGSTFGGNPLACRVGCKVLDITERDALPQRASELGQRLIDGLRRSLDGLPGIREIRGQALMVGIELDHLCDHLAAFAIERERLLINVTRGRTIRLLPALVASERDIDEIIERMSRLLSWYVRSVQI
ncbi:acetylornithine/succinylornithine family transaminase [Tepidiphilus sp. B18-69]|uniref:Acetylornithine aminotransferase n=2 Tax=Tepidiphilus baoligensis TaxID=2698687 RepID=A0ABX1QJI6_9PROT|nr:acetylornithine/succinylornithine family transaminase [Tepidiphilus baoligensis]